MSFSLEFTIQGLPQMSNRTHRGSWKARAGHARQWKRKVWAQCWHLRPEAPLKRAALTLIRCSSTVPDADGLVSGFKNLIDGLVEAKILENDRPANIGFPTYLHEKCARGKGHVRVKVEERA